jgi:quercetin dioxygenase-like cupin family protein
MATPARTEAHPAPLVLGPDDGLRLQSGPGRDLIFKATGEDTGGAFDYSIVEVAPHGGPPLHVHHVHAEAIHALEGRYKIRIGEETFTCEEGGFAYMPAGLPHAFLNLTGEPGRVVLLYTPGGAHRFFEEYGPLARDGVHDRATLAAVFARHDMTLLGPPLTAN